MADEMAGKDSKEKLTRVLLGLINLFDAEAGSIVLVGGGGTLATVLVPAGQESEKAALVELLRECANDMESDNGTEMMVVPTVGVRMPAQGGEVRQ